MITKRTLEQWRRDALRMSDKVALEVYAGTCDSLAKAYNELQGRILRLTAELLDQHLMKR